MRGFRQAGAIALLAVVWSQAVASQRTKFVERENAWTPAAPLALPTLGHAPVPAGGAGCVVVGYYIRRDGTVAAPRVMQGAFTGGTPESVQKSFAEAAIAASRTWTFDNSSRFRTPEPAFEWTVVGYGLVGESARHAASVGADDQDPRVRDECLLKDLAAWGTQHAVAANAAPDHGNRILFPFDEPSGAFWVIDGEMSPPKYPAPAYTRGIEGCVVVGYVVGSDGTPDQFRIIGSSTSPKDERAAKLLEEASLYAVSRWRFAPGPDNPQRIPALIQSPIDFMLGQPGRRSVDCHPVDLRAR